MGKIKILVGLGLVLALFPLRHGNAQSDGIQIPTSERIMSRGWWPTKGSAAREEYVGSAACAQCHKHKVQTQKTTPMANTAMAPLDSTFLTSRPKIVGQLGPYHYDLVHNDKQVQYSVSNGKSSASGSLIWVFGSGEHGQTYVYEQDGTFYESRVSYYASPQALDLTTGHSPATPSKVEAALGRPMDPDGARLCFGCHTTASTTHYRFDPGQLSPGVACEGCHGPGSRHVAAMNLDPDVSGPKDILNPANLSPIDSVEFCGVCHRSRIDVVLNRATGLEDVRFQGYRLETSKCFGTGDARITCIACHDPHERLVRDSGAYDKNCLACHAAKASVKAPADHYAVACPVKERDCVTCHMPKVEAPSMHSTFTDHRIRIVKAGAPFPE